MDTLIIGCGNLLRGDDGVGPILIRRLWEIGLPEGVRVADGGTAGMDVAFQMRGADRVIIVDACRTSAAPGTLYRVPGEQLEQIPPPEGINLTCISLGSRAGVWALVVEGCLSTRYYRLSDRRRML